MSQVDRGITRELNYTTLWRLRTQMIRRKPWWDTRDATVDEVTRLQGGHVLTDGDLVKVDEPTKHGSKGTAPQTEVCQRVIQTDPGPSVPTLATAQLLRLRKAQPQAHLVVLGAATKVGLKQHATRN